MKKIIRELFPPRADESNKGDYGYVALIGGSLEYSGAIRLAGNAATQTETGMGVNADARKALAAAGNAAMRAGAGVATIAAPRSICTAIIPDVLECTIYPLSDKGGEIIFVEEEFAKLAKRYTAIAIGMGIGNSPETGKAVKYLLENYDGVLIIDADGLNVLAKMRAGSDGSAAAAEMCAGDSEKLSKRTVPNDNILKNSRAQVVITPHLKEFSRLTGLTVDEIEKNPRGEAEKFAAENDIIVLLKGHTTYVTDGEKTYEIEKGCPGMATAGSGDVLSGILAAMCGCAAERVKRGACAEEDGQCDAIHENASDEELTGVNILKSEILKAVAGGAYINGVAGEIAQNTQIAATMTAGDTAASVKQAILATVTD